MTDLCAQAVQRRFEEPLSDTPVPEIRADGKRTEEADTAPLGHEIRAHELSAEFGGQSTLRVRRPAGQHVVGISETRRRIG